MTHNFWVITIFTIFFILAWWLQEKLFPIGVLGDQVYREWICWCFQLFYSSVLISTWNKTDFHPFFSNSRFIVGLFWLRTCGTWTILWYSLSVYPDGKSRTLDKWVWKSVLFQVEIRTTCISSMADYLSIICENNPKIRFFNRQRVSSWGLGRARKYWWPSCYRKERRSSCWSATCKWWYVSMHRHVIIVGQSQILIKEFRDGLSSDGPCSIAYPSRIILMYMKRNNQSRILLTQNAITPNTE